MPFKTSELWIQGATNWTQYAVASVGTWLQLVANAPVGGPAGFYEIVQTDTNTVKYNNHQFNTVYNHDFNANQLADICSTLWLVNRQQCGHSGRICPGTSRFK